MRAGQITEEQNLKLLNLVNNTRIYVKGHNCSHCIIRNFNYMRSLFILIALSFFISSFGTNNESENWNEEQEQGEQIKIIKLIPSTPVKDQYKTGTCWSFCTVSLLESELLRMNKGEFDLSEMYFVYQNYLRKAKKHVRMHGKVNFSSGGESNDVVDVMTLHGIVPEDIYSGLKVDSEKHIHSEMDKVLQEYVDVIITNPNEKLSNSWEEGFRKVLESYLGEVPTSFDYKGKSYTALSFNEQLGINPDDYIMITSFSHIPFYSSHILELPDNWSWKESYNVPLEELEQIVDSAIYNGYSVAWSTDISEEGFSFKKGLALTPEILYSTHSEKEKEKWSEKTEVEKDEIIFSMKNPAQEIKVNQSNRQEAFDNYNTTDDHGMHIIGIAEDNSKRKFYYVKNSWGINNPNKGYIYVSDAYFKYKTISIMLHKDAVPVDIAVKLKL